MKRKLITSDNESEHDDSAADEDYIPGKEDINSSDSESSVLIRKVQKKKPTLKRRGKLDGREDKRKLKSVNHPK